MSVFNTTKKHTWQPFISEKDWIIDTPKKTEWIKSQSQPTSTNQSGVSVGTYDIYQSFFGEIWSPGPWPGGWFKPSILKNELGKRHRSDQHKALVPQRHHLPSSHLPSHEFYDGFLRCEFHSHFVWPLWSGPLSKLTQPMSPIKKADFLCGFPSYNISFFGWENPSSKFTRTRCHRLRCINHSIAALFLQNKQNQVEPQICGSWTQSLNPLKKPRHYQICMTCSKIKL